MKRKIHTKIEKKYVSFYSITEFLSLFLISLTVVWRKKCNNWIFVEACNNKALAFYLLCRLSFASDCAVPDGFLSVTW